jgi:hypothetical protein
MSLDGVKLIPENSNKVPACPAWGGIIEARRDVLCAYDGLWISLSAETLSACPKTVTNTIAPANAKAKARAMKILFIGEPETVEVLVR